jgi:hypothetical protein
MVADDNKIVAGMAREESAELGTGRLDESARKISDRGWV